MTFHRQIPGLARRCASAAAIGAILCLPLRVAASEILLTVTGAIASDGPRTFDRAALSDLPRATITTSTVWTADVSRFTGVRLADLMDALGVKGGVLHAVALNDYAIDIPLGDAETSAAIIAYEVDGKPLSVREKGPLWIIYPYDSAVRFRTETIYGRSIWQLVRLDVLD